jgi:N-acetylmuramoyl-L-alanine amidase
MRSLPAALAAAALLASAAPATATVHTIAPGETLSGIAAAHGVSTSALAAANGISPAAFAISGRTLQLPGAGGAATATAPGGTAGHVVRTGETLSGIAAANGVSTSALAAANGLSTTSFAIAGTRLRIPARGSAATGTGGAATTTGTAAGGHLVAPGETLSGIAAANGLTTAALAAANGLSTTSFAIAGTRLRVPAGGAAGGGTGVTGSGAPEPMGGYTVRPGDTLSGLAARSRVTVAQIAYANGLPAGAPLVAGRVLKLPTGSPVLSAQGATTTGTAVPVATTASPHPTAARMTSSQVAAIAAQEGVPASLASAIAWQESGFNNGMVSSASARGVMQVMPGTWDWVQTYLAGSRRMNPFSAEDNVRAGSLYLRRLLEQSGGDPALAAAGYYQGLASVQRSGMLPETRRYVANVLALRSRFGG